VYKDPRGNFKRKDLGTCLSQASSGTTERARRTFWRFPSWSTSWATCCTWRSPLH